MEEQNTPHGDSDKPVLLRAIELILAKPAEIKKEAQQCYREYHKKYNRNRSEAKIKDMAADHIISNYSYYTAFVGGATGLAGIIPGLGTAIATFGGATADAALTMKYQIEMTMALATIYEHDIMLEEEQRLCLIIAGLGAINEAAKKGGKAIGTKAFVKMAQQYLRGGALVAVREIFRKVGITFTRKALEKSIPFGIGVIVGFAANKGLTWYVGSKARDFFKAYDDGSVEAPGKAA